MTDTERTIPDAAAPFRVGELVETFKGAEFWGEVASVYDLGPARFPGEPHGWRVDVRAIAPSFRGSIHVYPATQLRRRAAAALPLMAEGVPDGKAMVDAVAKETRPLSFDALTMDEHRDIVRKAFDAGWDWYAKMHLSAPARPANAELVERLCSSVQVLIASLPPNPAEGLYRQAEATAEQCRRTLAAFRSSPEGVEAPAETGSYGDLDFPAPNHFDPNKRGFDPK